MELSAKVWIEPGSSATYNTCGLRNHSMSRDERQMNEEGWCPNPNKQPEVFNIPTVCVCASGRKRHGDIEQIGDAISALMKTSALSPQRAGMIKNIENEVNICEKWLLNTCCLSQYINQFESTHHQDTSSENRQMDAFNSFLSSFSPVSIEPLTYPHAILLFNDLLISIHTESSSLLSGSRDQ
ncbi:hypothetical protein JOB18_046998 [Solea senegalensis]|uniref:Uncharacterized protein n=1 Tax=Solea senegalensis TaxID=28829 RepID=A0AAV6SVH9_SOLSE|nr:hypothetical protein JOB18_046998 [Solea senegalensis]